jgi:hypothetical protein
MLIRPQRSQLGVLDPAGARHILGALLVLLGEAQKYGGDALALFEPDRVDFCGGHSTISARLTLRT